MFANQSIPANNLYQLLIKINHHLISIPANNQYQSSVKIDRRPNTGSKQKSLSIILQYTISIVTRYHITIIITTCNSNDTQYQHQLLFKIPITNQYQYQSSINIYHSSTANLKKKTIDDEPISTISRVKLMDQH